MFTDFLFVRISNFKQIVHLIIKIINKRVQKLGLTLNLDLDIYTVYKVKKTKITIYKIKRDHLTRVYAYYMCLIQM